MIFKMVKEKLKILYIIPTMGGGGAEVMLGAIAEELHKRGHEILLVTLYDHHETFINFPNKDFIEKHIEVKKCSTRVEISFR